MSMYLRCGRTAAPQAWSEYFWILVSQHVSKLNCNSNRTMGTCDHTPAFPALFSLRSQLQEWQPASPNLRSLVSLSTVPTSTQASCICWTARNSSRGISCDPAFPRRRSFPRNVQDDQDVVFFLRFAEQVCRPTSGSVWWKPGAPVPMPQ